MDFTKAMENANEYATKWREHGVTSRGDVSMCPQTFFWREDRLISVAHAAEGNRDSGLRQAMIGISGYEATHVIFVSDAYAQLPGPDAKPLSEDEKEELLRMPAGTLQERFANGDPNVVECIFFSGMARDGSAAIASRHYQADYGAHTIEWLTEFEVHQTDNPEQAKDFLGIVPDALRKAFAAPSLGELLMEMAGMTPESVMADEKQRHIHQDIATTKAIMAMAGGMVAHGTHNDEEELAAVTRSFSREGWGLYDPNDPDADLYGDDLS